MKKHLFLFLALLLLSIAPLCAQTAIYKAFLGKPGISASCIADYPVGNSVKVDVTMLKADDSSSFKTLMHTLKSLPYGNDKSGKRPSNADEFSRRLKHFSASDSLSSPNARKILGSISNLEMTITPNAPSGGSSTNKRFCSFTTFSADPLPGDRGIYEILHSSGTLTVLVFHCPNEETAQQVFRFVLNRMLESTKKQ